MTLVQRNAWCSGMRVITRNNHQYLFIWYLFIFCVADSEGTVSFATKIMYLKEEYWIEYSNEATRCRDANTRLLCALWTSKSNCIMMFRPTSQTLRCPQSVQQNLNRQCTRKAKNGKNQRLCHAIIAINLNIYLFLWHFDCAEQVHCVRDAIQCSIQYNRPLNSITSNTWFCRLAWGVSSKKTRVNWCRLIELCIKYVWSCKPTVRHIEYTTNWIKMRFFLSSSLSPSRLMILLFVSIESFAANCFGRVKCLLYCGACSSIYSRTVPSGRPQKNQTELFQVSGEKKEKKN